MAADPLARYLRKPFGYKELEDVLRSFGYGSAPQAGL
jgi:hypothetical protein